jgi:hypothetical protein
MVLEPGCRAQDLSESRERGDWNEEDARVDGLDTRSPVHAEEVVDARAKQWSNTRQADALATLAFAHGVAGDWVSNKESSHTKMMAMIETVAPQLMAEEKMGLSVLHGVECREWYRGFEVVFRDAEAVNDRQADLGKREIGRGARER